MKDGYYLSTFLAFDESANDKGVKLRHDQCVSLWKKHGDLVTVEKYWELERITGKKQYSDTFNNKESVIALIEILLEEEGIKLTDVNEIWGTNGLENQKNFYHDTDVSFHSVAHIFTSLFSEGSNVFNNEVIISLAADAGPDNLWEDDAFAKNFYSGAVSKNGNIEYFPISSPGFMWAHARKRLGMREGSLMALASATKAKLINYPIPQFVEKDIYNRSTWPEMAQYIDNLISYAEQIDYQHDTGETFSGFDKSFSLSENITSMVMKEVQEVSNLIMEKNVDLILKKYNINPEDAYLGLSGGFCLNCPANSFLLDKFGFKGLLASPCVSDTGIALGQALYYFYYETQGQFKFKSPSPYLGQEFKGNAWEHEFSSYIETKKTYDSKTFVNDISDYPIVWFNSRAEIGPRALGNRSILSDPRTIEMKNHLNEIKQREWWRPVAPIVLEDKMDKFFEESKRAPLMLELLNVKSSVKEQIPAICHLDLTARVQTLSRNDNIVLYDAINDFYKETGVPIICNTSLNDKGEPIINSPEEAFNFALRKGIKILYINRFRYKLNNKPFNEETPRKRMDIPHIASKERSKLSEDLTNQDLTFYWDNKHLFTNESLQDIIFVEKLKSGVKNIIDTFGYLAR
tara:strand:+ start:5431 stop:7323 length:1893 start_codon:yes stop_codon:yes gene_type:complete